MKHYILLKAGRVGNFTSPHGKGGKYVKVGTQVTSQPVEKPQVVDVIEKEKGWVQATSKEQLQKQLGSFNINGIYDESKMRNKPTTLLAIGNMIGEELTHITEQNKALKSMPYLMSIDIAETLDLEKGYSTSDGQYFATRSKIELRRHTRYKDKSINYGGFVVSTSLASTFRHELAHHIYSKKLTMAERQKTTI